MSDDELEEGEIDEFGRHPRPPLPRAGADSRLDLELDEGNPHLDHVEEPPSLGETLAGKSWGDLISLLQNDPAGINLHTGLTFDEVAKELEARLQSLAAEGDSLMLYIRRMAATVKKMPMAPVLCLLMSAVNMTLRLRRYNISTSVDGEKSVPFRGYSADFDAPCGWSGGGKSILLECLGAPLIQSVLGELLRVEEKGIEGEYWHEFAQRLSYLELENGDMVGFKESGSAAAVANLLKEHPRLFFPKIIIPEGDEWTSVCVEGKSPVEVAMWTKFWDAFSKLAKGTGMVDVSRSKFALQLLLVLQPDVLARVAGLEAKKKNGLFGRISPLPFSKDPFEYDKILGAGYDNLLQEKFRVEFGRLSGELQLMATRLVLASWVSLEFPPNCVVTDYEEEVASREEVKARGGAAEEDEDDMTASQQAAQVAMAIPISLDTLQIKAAPRGGSAAPAQTLNTTPHVPRSARPASHGGGDNSSESGKSSTSTESSKVKTQLSTREQDQLAMDQLCIMLPMLHSEGGQPNTHEVTVAMMSRYDGEYHLQNKFKAKSDANKVFAAAAGKGTEHMLRKACTVQVLKNGVGLMNLLVGSHHIPLADADGNPLFLKHLIKTSVERRDLKLGIHFLAGDQDGAGLVPTIDTNTMRISNLLAASGLKTSYVAVKMSGAAGSQDGPATPEQLAEGLEAPVPLHPEPRVPQTPLISTMASILGSTFFFSTPAENDPKHKPFFAEAARALEAKGLGYVFIDQTIYGPSNSGAAASLGLLADGAISRTGGKMSYFVKQLSYTSHRSELAECGLSLSINYDSLLYAGDKAKRPEKEKILRLMSIMCSLACEAARRDVLTSPGVFRDAVIQVFPFAGGSLSAISAAANKADGNPTLKKQSAALEEFIANKESLLFVHKALLQLAIYAKKKHNPTEFQDVLMLADLERMIPATPPRAPEPAPKKKRDDV